MYACLRGHLSSEPELIPEIERISPILHAFEMFRIFFGSSGSALTFAHRHIGRVVGDLISVFAISAVAATLMRVEISFGIPSSRVQTSRAVMINVWVWLWCTMIVSVVQWRWVVCIDAWKMWIFVIGVIMIEVEVVMWMNMWEVSGKGIGTDGIGMHVVRFYGFVDFWRRMVGVNGTSRRRFVRRLVTGVLRVSVVCGITCWEFVIDCVKIIGLAWGASIWGGVGKAGASDGCCQEVTCWAAGVGGVSSRRRRGHEDWRSRSPACIRGRERTLRWSWGWKICASGCRLETFKDTQFY